MTGGPTVIPGKTGQALSFDGVDDYVSIPHAASLAGARPMTTTAWVKRDASGENDYIFKKRGDTNDGWAMVINSSNQISVVFFGIATKNSTDTITDTNWHHVAVSIDASGIPTFYIDGISAGTASAFASSPTSTSSNVYIGAELDSAGAITGYNDAVIDEARIYNTDLSAAQIQSIYKQGQSDEVNSSASQPNDVGRLDAGVAGYWALDDGSSGATPTTATDSSGNSNSGTLTGGPTWTTGQIGNAVTFDGTDDYINLGNPAAVQSLRDFSVSVWINVDSARGVSTDYIMSQYNGGSVTAGDFLLYVNSSDQINFNIDGSSGTGDVTTSAITEDAWHHVTVSVDADKRVDIYIDGVLNVSDTSIGTTAPYLNGADSLHIGDMTTTTNPFQGEIDEVRFYRRTLSSDEVSKLYALTAVTKVDTSLRGYWSFDGADIVSTTTYDRSGAGNNGTLTNSPTVTPGKVGQALSFDGTDDYVDAGSASSLDNLTTFTVTAWIKPDTISSTSKRIVSKAGSGFTDGWILIACSSDGTNCTGVNNTISFAASFSTTTGRWRTAADTLSSNQWNFVAVTYDRGSTSNDPALYINGTSVSVTEVAAPSGTYNADSSASLWIGRGSTYFPGTIDEVRVYSSILSAAQIQSLYKQGQSDEVNTGTSQPQGGGRLDSGLAGYWKLDDGSGTSATDSSTNGNTGTLTNGPTWGTGQIGGAVTLDGTDDYVSVPQNGKFTLSSRPFTISAWVKYTGTLSGIDKRIVSWHDGSKNIQLALDSPDGAFFIFNDSATSTWSQSTITQAVADTWYHVTATFDGASTYQMYLNGKVDEAGSGSSVAVHNSDSTTLYIGQRGNGSTSYFPGTIDEVRIYNRVLSSEEVGQLYRLTAPTGTETGLKGYWSFNGKDISGTTAYDRSGAGNTGTTSGSPSVTPGKIGQGIALDGSDDYISIADASSIDYDYNQDFSFSVWVKLPSTQSDTSGGDNFIIEKWSASGGYPYVLRVYNQTYGTSGDRGKVVFRRYDGTNSPGVTSTSALNDNAWHHVVGTKSGSTLRIYIDGASQGTSTDTTTTTTTNASPLYIGTRGGSTNNLTGSVDEFRLYNRVLTADEVSALYLNR